MTEQTDIEGVIKFELEFNHGPAPSASRVIELQVWFRILRQLDLLGQSPNRYQGYAYGNLSRRDAEGGFIITGSQTAGLKALLPEHFSRVKAFDAMRNQLRAEGPIKPSSEAMTHGMLYRLLPNAQFVFHIHNPAIWQAADRLQLPITDPDAAYGTPAMAGEVSRLLQVTGLSSQGVLVMGGHIDGVISFGQTANEAGDRLINALAGALATTE